MDILELLKSMGPQDGQTNADFLKADFTNVVAKGIKKFESQMVQIIGDKVPFVVGLHPYDDYSIVIGMSDSSALVVSLKESSYKKLEAETDIAQDLKGD